MSTTQVAPAAERDGQAAPAAPPADRPSKPPARWSWRPLLVLGVVALLLAGLFASGLLPRLRQQKETEAATENGPPAVNVVTVRAAPAKADLALPGNSRAFEETAIFARTNGYLKRWRVEMGDRVEEDQLLAEIDTPELDRELEQARAAVAQAKANLERDQASAKLAQALLDRARRAGAAAAMSELDERQGALRTAAASAAASRASIKVNEANVRRLEELQSFQKVKSPFAGIVTARNYDRGALINAGTPPAGSAPTPPAGSASASGSRELFRVAQTDTLRVFVNVPQAFAPLVRVGQAAEVRVREFPGRGFPGKVTRTAGALDPASRTLNTEVQVPNQDGPLLPGMYVQVKFVLRRARPAVLVPGNALLSRNDGTYVAVVGADDALRYRKVEVGRDYGSRVEVVVGLEGGEALAVNLTEELADGTTVRKVASSDEGGR